MMKKLKNNNGFTIDKLILIPAIVVGSLLFGFLVGKEVGLKNPKSTKPTKNIVEISEIKDDYIVLVYDKADKIAETYKFENVVEVNKQNKTIKVIYKNGYTETIDISKAYNIEIINYSGEDKIKPELI